MYSTKLFIVLFVTIVSGYDQNQDDLKLIDSIHPEPQCSSAGGICTIAKDCPSGNLAEVGLCPEQQSRGVECCYGISVKETRCRRRGGECSSGYCRDSLKYQATDCPKDTTCCIQLFR